MRYIPKGRPLDFGDLRFQLVRNAAFVAYEGQKAKALMRWERQNEDRRVVFLFDTDVIKTLCAPWITGPVNERNLGDGYGQILPQRPLLDFDPDERQKLLGIERRKAESIAWLLANKAAQTAFQYGTPILQTTAHSLETFRVFESVKFDAAAEADVSRSSVDDREEQFFGQSLRIVANRLNNTDESFVPQKAGRFLADVLRTVEQRNLQRSSRFVREWDAFATIVRLSNGIFSLSDFAPSDKYYSSHLKCKLENVSEELRKNDTSVALELAELEMSLRDVVAPSSYRFGKDRLATDGLAVAELIYANRRLAQLQASDVRVVLITGDRKLVLALADSRQPSQAGDDRQLRGFAFDHVLHIWSFVDSITGEIQKAVSRGEPKASATQMSGSELFSGLLAFPAEVSEPAKHLERLARNAVTPERDLTGQILPHEIEHAYERWNEFSEDAVGLHRHFLFNPVKYDEIAKILLAKFEAIDSRIDGERLGNLAVETMARARDRTNVEFSEIGANSVLNAHKNGVRNPPDLMFDSLEVTNQIFRDLSLPKRVFVTSAAFSNRFEQIVEDCYRPNSEDPLDDDYRQECYLKYLVLGALFASANLWIVAEQHAESAVKIVERANWLRDPIRTRSFACDVKSTNMSGREAYYLLAVSSRVRARTRRRYDDARNWLVKARSSLAADREEGTAAGVPFIRFDCEDLAISLGHYYHARSENKDDPCDALADEISRSAQRLLDVREMMVQNDAEENVTVGDQYINVTAAVKTTIATNLLQVGVVQGYRSSKNYVGSVTHSVDESELHRALDDLVTHTDLISQLSYFKKEPLSHDAPSDPSIICSPLILLYSVVGAMVGKMERIWRPGNVEEIDRLFDAFRTNVTYYDDWRFQSLREYAKSIL
ncbi:hypothetical protein [Aestuariivita sp.]|jgi:hypothetical protein|uniref:hypothetical protein n=1 Tax=Aestuariivita sp. TaxID=1872407 RepID=UPI00216CAFCC|nr:hypothetical protein [Aestuariivita sp.]MCE8006398.1 hypothetical protein [Aestuariivita sp.]